MRRMFGPFAWSSRVKPPVHLPHWSWKAPFLIVLYTCGAGQHEGPNEDVPKVHLEVEFQFATELVLGSERVPLTQFQSVTVDEADRIFIAQPVSGHVLVLSSEGEAERIIGGRGDGPGEFQRVRRVGFTDDGMLWVSDPGARRVTFFDAEGELVRTLRVPGPPLGSPNPLEALAAFSDGAMLLMDRNIMGLPESAQDSLSAYGVLPGDHELHHLAQSSVRGRTFSLFSPDRHGAIVSPQPVTTSTVVAPLASGPGAVIVPPGRPEGDSVWIVLTSLGGDTLRTVAYERDPLPVSDSLRLERTDRFVERAIDAGLYGNPSDARRAVSEALVIPEFWPAAQEVVPSAGSDEIWLRVGQDREGREIYEHVRWSHHRDVSEVQRVVAPSGVRLLWGGQLPLGRYADDWGQHILVRLKPQSLD